MSYAYLYGIIDRNPVYRILCPQVKIITKPRTILRYASDVESIIINIHIIYFCRTMLGLPTEFMPPIPTSSVINLHQTNT